MHGAQAKAHKGTNLCGLPCCPLFHSLLARSELPRPPGPAPNSPQLLHGLELDVAAGQAGRWARQVNKVGGQEGN